MIQTILNNVMPQMTACKDRCNMNLLAWKSEHRREYAEFKQRISQIENGDISVLEDLLTFAGNCMPSKEENLPDGLDDILKNAMTITKSDLPQYVQSYLTDIANDCQREDEIEDSDSDMCQDILDDVMENFASCTDYVEGFLSSLKEQSTQQNTLLYCFYCWITFDQGISKMSGIMSTLLDSGAADQEDLVLIRCCIDMLVPNSMEHGGDNKSSWEKNVQNVNPEIWKEVMWQLHNTNGKRGHHKKLQTLDDLLIGDKQKLKALIRMFLQKETEAQSLAYLLKALINAERIREDISYMDFHRAIEHFTGHKYGHDKPQQRYSYMKNMPSALSGRIKNNSLKKARRIVMEWTDTFSED